mmetsp:Transcript_29602/g.76470  ORF Transcript_29602/g.76470 Transcript_29602/m.76470 type:complete len:117 (-) Transcript_29602:1963-2313(-)
MHTRDRAFGPFCVGLLLDLQREECSLSSTKSRATNLLLWYLVINGFLPNLYVFLFQLLLFQARSPSEIVRDASDLNDADARFGVSTFPNTTRNEIVGKTYVRNRSIPVPATCTTNC